MSDVLAKKHESLATIKEIIDSLRAMFGQPKWFLRHETIKYIYTKRMKEGTSVREDVLDMMMHFNIAEVNGGAIDEANQGKGKTPKQNKGKKAVEKDKCYHCDQNGHWLRNCPKYLAEKKAEKKTQGAIDHICLSFQENSSWKRLSEGEITLKVGTGEMVLAEVVGDLKLYF
ncbi:gag/pol protein [Cucumis melo var. makuwa]|uniref:Gag/pol protein n=1 Tax=Cucumis melo var. makuwa TaxID=1194695 RepID=A0A5A7UDE8_CUCMM|nr:gag/pol protein [Cucumis melo var. makuwa]TYK01790.1 gag/pol protein [Cucumis melo var. makuwa]